MWTGRPCLRWNYLHDTMMKCAMRMGIALVLQDSTGTYRDLCNMLWSEIVLGCSASVLGLVGSYRDCT